MIAGQVVKHCCARISRDFRGEFGEFSFPLRNGKRIFLNTFACKHVLKNRVLVKEVQNKLTKLTSRTRMFATQALYRYCTTYVKRVLRCEMTVPQSRRGSDPLPDGNGVMRGLY